MVIERRASEELKPNALWADNYYEYQGIVSR
jgi:hypothetical protein